MRKYISWAMRFVFWLSEMSILWSVLVVFTLSTIIPIYLGSEFSFRLCGAILQLLSIIFVIKGIVKVREYFELPSIYKVFNDWWERCPCLTQSTVVDVSGISAFSFLEDVHATKWHPAPTADDNMEARMKAAEANLNTLRSDLTNLQTNMRSRLSQLEQNFEEGRDNLQKAIAETSGKLMRSKTDGLSLSLMGAIWLFFGVILTTFSNELALAFS